MIEDLGPAADPKYTKGMYALREQEFVLKLNGTQLALVLEFYYSGYHEAMPADPLALVMKRLLPRAVPIHTLKEDDFLTDAAGMAKMMNAAAENLTTMCMELCNK